MVKPDPDMMSQALHEARLTLNDLGEWLSYVGFSVGHDADHDISHRSIWNLAERLEEHTAKLRKIATDGNNRVHKPNP